MKAHHKSAFFSCVIVLAMLGLSFASVPLYDAFCRLTGFGGTPQKVEGHGAPIILDRVMDIRFDANIDPELDWEFRPNEPKITVRVGEIVKTSYYAENKSNKVLKGQASFNVTPDQAGFYFSKIHCFCFEEQVLQPGQKVDMPIIFFVKHEMDKDLDMDGVKTITLSYHFYPIED